ncbi:uncharacterized protein LOC131670542 [Phymastichus coffea]|uniref:uncharacterized protein LOC131670542 n=1 Tax=Phymastichus coffea TaxID=108790 RepID=UPI00273C746C|nr:uncharacterized protein LOC131670542 [Phymastichus coffea]
MPKIQSSSSDSSSDDDCDIYTNAASKLNALNNQKKSNNRNKVQLNDEVIEINNSERVEQVIPPISEAEPIVNNDSSVGKAESTIQVKDIYNENPVVCIIDDELDDECVMVNHFTPPRTTRSSKIKKALVPKMVSNSKSFNDSIELELNKSYDSVFDLTQEDDNYVMIGSPELKSPCRDNTEVTIKVMWKSDQCIRFELKKYETFQKIFKHLAQEEGIPENQVLITKRDKKIHPFDTPVSINWSILDILEGGVVSANLVKKHKGLGNSEQNDALESGCKLKIQISDKKTLMLTLKHHEPFSKLMRACSQELNVQESKIKLYFDGELIEMDDTPESLDLEDEGCIDCKISK